MTTPTFDPLAKAAMVARCRWDPTEVVTDRAITLDSDGAPILLLPSLHVTAVTAAHIVNDDGTTRDLIVGPADGAEVTWREDGELRWRGCGPGWPCGDRNVVVTYSGGYTDVPADLAAALTSLGKRTATVPAYSRKMGTAAVTIAASIAEGALLVTEQMVFDRYRIIGTA
jgi:hypothetical protein